MDKINGSPLMRPGLLDRFKVANKEKDGSEATSAVNSNDRPTTKPADKAEISDTAHKLMDLRAAVDVGREAIDGLPDIREDRIVEAKKRLEQGYYNSQVVQDRLAGNLAKILGKIDEL